jgi:hypothetical protein
MEAVLRWRDHEPDWYGYALGYRRAVEFLCAVVEERAAYQDTLIFPIGALCRHAIELSLKRLLAELDSRWGGMERLRLTHNMVGLWNAAEPTLARLELSDPETDRRLARSIAGFAELDVSGQAFRYPVATDGTAALAGPGINIAQLRDAALGVVAELEALTDAVIHDADLAHEAMIDEAQAWWAGLSDDERDEYEAAEEELHAAYLDGHIDPNG